MKLKIKTAENLSVGDVLSVEFYLDDIHRSFIHKKVTVRNIMPGYVGTEFHGREIVGKALGFYLYF